MVIHKKERKKSLLSVCAKWLTNLWFPACYAGRAWKISWTWKTQHF